MARQQIRCSRKIHNILLIKKKATGKSMADLVEFAVMNMPYIPPKEIK